MLIPGRRVPPPWARPGDMENMPLRRVVEVQGRARVLLLV